MVFLFVPHPDQHVMMIWASDAASATIGYSLSYPRSRGVQGLLLLSQPSCKSILKTPCKGRGREWDGWESGVSRCKLTFRMDRQWGPTLQHRELYPVSWDGSWWKIVWEKNMCVYIYIYMYVYRYAWLGHSIYIYMTCIYVHVGHTYKHMYDLHVYVWLGHCAVQRKSTQHCKSTIF